VNIQTIVGGKDDDDSELFGDDNLSTTNSKPSVSTMPKPSPHPSIPHSSFTAPGMVVPPQQQFPSTHAPLLHSTNLNTSPTTSLPPPFFPTGPHGKKPQQQDGNNNTPV
jgi:hypothetical protein